MKQKGTTTNQLLLVAFVNLALILIGIFVLELIFGDWISPNQLNKLHVVRNCKLHFSASHLYSTGQTAVTYTRDEYGLRGHFRVPADVDIVTVGGSTTDQRYITDDSTWQSVLESELTSAGFPLSIANAGIDGQSTFGHIKNFEWWFPHIPGFRPKLVLFYIGINDIINDGGGGSDRLGLSEGRWSIYNFLKEKSAIAHLLHTLWGIYYATFIAEVNHQRIDFASLEWTDTPLNRDPEGLMGQRLASFQRRVEVLIESAASFGAKVVIVVQPSREYKWQGHTLLGATRTRDYFGTKINGVDYYYMLRAMYRAAETQAAESGALFIDAEKYLKLSDHDFYDFGHMTPSGAQKLGRFLSKELIASGAVHS